VSEGERIPDGEHAGSHALDREGTIELARIERGGLVESRHSGAAALVGPDGGMLRSLGDPAALVYPRSTLKLLQAIAVLRAGTPLEGEQLAIAAASHAGGAEHVAVVERMLASVDLTADALQCPVDWPLGRENRDALVRSGGSSSRLHMNCSGKHASFLLACVANGWNTDDYLDPSHPLQRLVVETVAEFTGEPVVLSGVDGCGAPVHAVTLAGLARAIGRVTGPSAPGSPEARLSAAIRESPWVIDGSGRANTLVIEQLGLIAKLGAEGVMVMGAPDGHAVAVKILDGSLRPATMVALELLIQQGIVTREAAQPVLDLTTERITGGGHPVGALVTTF